jgi:CHAT domain-containing protein
MKAVGERIHALLPLHLLNNLRQHDCYIRLASNVHILPFELAYDSADKEFLGDARRIGRIHITELLATLPPVRLPSFLLIGADGASLPMVSAEIDRLSAVLNNQEVSLAVLAGSQVTRQNLAAELDRQKPTVIHFAGHALAGSAEVPRLLLNDGDVHLNELLSQSVEGALVFLSACSTGFVLNEFSRLLFERAGSSLVGFVAPVSDVAASVLAIRFYEEIVAGATLGDAVRAARRHQREVSPDDHTWASLVLFGDPTIRLFPNATSLG